MLSDCGYIKLLNQAPDDANDIARLLHISDEEKRYIENAEVGSGLLIADKVVVPFNNTFPQDTELFRLMDTNPNSSKQKSTHQITLMSAFSYLLIRLLCPILNFQIVDAKKFSCVVCYKDKTFRLCVPSN